MTQILTLSITNQKKSLIIALYLILWMLFLTFQALKNIKLLGNCGSMIGLISTLPIQVIIQMEPSLFGGFSSMPHQQQNILKLEKQRVA